MARLATQSGRILFAPLIWRLALKIEQVPFDDIAESPGEAVFVLNAARRLFQHDVHCVSFDTWLETEAAGATVVRDQWGAATERPAAPGDGWTVDAVLAAAGVQRNVEIVRRLALDGGGAIPLATLTAPATLLARLGAGRRDDIREMTVGLARAYCEAGAGALLLLDEEPSGDFAELSEFAALFNLADYYNTPIVILSRDAVTPIGVAAAATAGGLLVTPDFCGDGVAPLPPAEEAAGSWLAMSRWEVDPDTDPNTIAAWRQRLIQS